MLAVTESATGSPYVTWLKGIGSKVMLTKYLITSGQIVVDGEYDIVVSGLNISNPDGSCVKIINGAINIVIENSDIGPCGKNGITVLSGSNNITIHNTYIHDTNNDGIYVYKSKEIGVTNNQIERVATGVYVENSRQVVINKNTIRNVKGPFPRGQLVLFNNVKGPGNRITNNIGINETGASHAEDAINLYKSSGVPEGLIIISNNIIVGGGPSTSGGGILLGDGGGSSSYQIAKDNILVNPGQYGVGVAGGHHNFLINNTVYSKQFSFTNVGVYVWDQYKSNCRDITVRNNAVNWTNKDGVKNGSWNGGNCGPIDGWSNNDWDAPIEESIVGNN